jgi:hypothetical protein
MKRSRGSCDGQIASLAQMALCSIVGPFGDNEAAFKHYCTLVAAHQPRVLPLLHEAWGQRVPVCTKRRVVGARLTLEYADTRMLAVDGSVLARVLGHVSVPVTLNGCTEELQLVMESKDAHTSPMQMTRSKQHRGARFTLH